MPASIDSTIRPTIDAVGYAQIIAVLRPGKTPRAAAAIPEAMLSPGELPPGRDLLVCAFSLLGPARAKSARPKRGKAHRAAKVFPRLGVAVGMVDEEGLERCRADPAVESVHRAEQLSLIRPVEVAKSAATSTSAAWGVRKIGAPALWARGFTGQGVRVGHLDTGVDGRHPAIRPALERGKFVAFDLAGNPQADAPARDSEEHGTHTAGTLCGGKAGRTAVGVAPGADLYSAMVIEGGDIVARVLGGLEWVLENRVRVLSMSLGVRGYTPVWRAVFQSLRSQGVLPVIAVGNEGPGTSRSPGNYPESLSVGAVDSKGRVPLYSGSMSFEGPPAYTAPKVVAPGVNISSARPGPAFGVQSMSGTSMATPHVAGLAALLMSAKPDATIDQVERAIVSSAVRLAGTPDAREGAGLVNAPAALEALG